MHPPPASDTTYSADTRLLCRAEAVHGWAVEDCRGCVLGTVNDLLVDLALGRIAYVVVATGGLAGLGEAHLPLPWEALELPRDGSAHFIWHGDAAQATALPVAPPTH